MPYMFSQLIAGAPFGCHKFLPLKIKLNCYIRFFLPQWPATLSYIFYYITWHGQQVQVMRQTLHILQLNDTE